MVPVTDNQVRVHEATCKRLARRYVGRAGAEFDDLVQEGRIAVFLSLQDGIEPTASYIDFYMKGYVKQLRRQVQ